MSRLYVLCPSPRSVGTSPRPRNCIASIAPGGGRWNEHSLCHPWTNDSVRSRSNETPWNATGQHHNSWLLPMRGSHQLHTPHSASEPFTQAAAEDSRSDIGIVLRCRKPRVFNRQKYQKMMFFWSSNFGAFRCFQTNPSVSPLYHHSGSITQLLLVKHWIFALRWSWCPRPKKLHGEHSSRCNGETSTADITLEPVLYINGLD